MSPQVIANVGPDDIHLVAAQYRFLTGQEVIQNKPTLTVISPTTIVAGSAQFTLTVTGTNFVTGLSKVYWGADPLATTFVSATSLTAEVPASAVAVAGVFPVTVITGPLVSQSINFEVTAAELTEEETEPTPDSTWLKVDIVNWLLEKGVELDEPALSSLTKTELLELVTDVLSPAPAE